MTSGPERMRAGGELTISATRLAAAGSRTGLETRFAGRHCIWTDTGRSALLLAAHAIRASGGKPRVWIPAYACESASRPWLQAGFSIQYYEAGAELGRHALPAQPCPEAGETFLFIHYFGHYNQPMADLAVQLRGAGVWIVEDCVQASLMPAAGAVGDFACTSYRKVLPVVDGAALLSRTRVDTDAPGTRLEASDESFVSARAMGKMLRGAGAEAAEFLPLIEFSESRVEGAIVPRQISWLSSWMLERLDWNEAVARRRANWTQLMQKISAGNAAGHATPVTPALGDGDAPLGLPITVAPEQRDGLRKFLAASEIYCAVHWNLDHLPAGLDFAFERGLASSMLTLPTDQDMSPAQVDHVAGRLDAFFAAA